MRNFVLLTSVLVTLFTPSFVSGAPVLVASTNPDTRLSRRTPADQFVDTPGLERVGLAHPPNTTPGHANDSDTAAHTNHGQEDPNGPKYKYVSSSTSPVQHNKRASDDQTAGGNAYSGSTGDVSSGDVTNDAGSGTVTNNGGNNSAQAGSSVSGNATGGNGDGAGPGGNAYTGAAGNAAGGSVSNIGGTVNNMGTGGNNAGQGGTSRSGTAQGGSS